MKGLEALRGWLASHAVTDAAMESTGVYWRPVWAVLEDDFRLLLVNARHIKHVPGRRTDVRDCEWLAQFYVSRSLAWGLRLGAADDGTTEEGREFRRLPLYTETSYAFVQVDPVSGEAWFKL